MIMIRDIFMYMDRTFVPQHRKRPVYDLGLWLFRKAVWERDMNDFDDEDDEEEQEREHHRGGNAKGGNGMEAEGMKMAVDDRPIKSSHSSSSSLLLGTIASSLMLQAIHQDRLDRLEDAPQRMALLRDLIHMLLELGHATNSGGGGGGGQYNDTAILGGGSGGSSGGGGMDCIPVYERDFEEVFLGESQDFYRRESTSRLSHSVGILQSNNNDSNNNDEKPAARYSAMEYVHRAQSRLEEEKARATVLELPTQTKSALLRIVETELIERHAKTLVDMEGSGFACILKVVASSPAVGSVAAAAAAAAASSSSSGGGANININNRLLSNNNNMAGGIDSSESGVVIDRERISDLAAMYDLFSRVPSSVNHLRDALSERIRLDGRSLVRDQETNVAPPSAFVKGVLDMRERFHAVVSSAMRGEKKAQKRMSEAFEDFLNADARAANCLAVYVDELLRVGLRGADERQVARELDRVIVVFPLLGR